MAIKMILLTLYSKMLLKKKHNYIKINSKFIATKHQVHFQPMRSSSSNTEGT